MKVGLYLFTICLTVLCFGQSEMTKLLSYPLSDDEMSLVLAREEYLQNHKFNSPWLRELDFRVRPNNRETTLTDYRLRFGLLNPMEMKANRDHYKLLLSQQGFERKKTINNVLQRRYELILETYYLSESKQLIKDQLSHYQEVKKIMIDEAYDFSDIVKQEHDITKLELQLSDYNRSINVINEGLKLYELDQLPSWADHEWITIEQITNLAMSTLSGETMKLLTEQQKLEQDESILRIKKAEVYSNLGFIQAEYDKTRGDTRDDHIRFQFGVSVPIFNTDRPDNQRRELELLEDQVDYQMLVREEEQERNTDVINLLGLIEDWQMVQSKQEQLAEYTILSEQLGSDLESYERLAAYDFYLRDQVISLKVDVLMKLISLLHSTGRLSDEPSQNFLARDLEAFEVSY